MNRLNKSVVIIGMFLVVFGVFSVLASRPTASALTNCTTSSAGLDSSESTLASLINETRADAGLSALSVSGNLSRAAAWKSEDPSASPPLSHTDSLGRLHWQRILDCDYPSGGTGEIIAWGFSSPQSVLNAWMASSGHRAAILSSSYVTMGLGRAGSAWTVDFGIVDDSGGGTTPSPTSSAAPPTSTATPIPPTSTATASPTPTPTAPGGQGITVPLAAGFNFVTYAGQRQLTGHVFDNLTGLEIWVYGWNEQSKSWDRFFRPAPGYLNTLTSLEPGRAYMIWVSQPVLWEY